MCIGVANHKGLQYLAIHRDSRWGAAALRRRSGFALRAGYRQAVAAKGNMGGASPS